MACTVRSSAVSAIVMGWMTVPSAAVSTNAAAAPACTGLLNVNRSVCVSVLMIAPLLTVAETSAGGARSWTSVIAIGAVTVTLPFVSVARTASVTAVPPLDAIVGSTTLSSKGYCRSVRTDWPFNSTSVLRI